MLVKGISRADLEAAVEIASGTLGNRLQLYAIYPANRRRRNAWRFRVKVADPDAPGARRYFRRYGLRLTNKVPKRSHDPCTHALGALCVAIFERKPYAQVETIHPVFLGGSASGMRGSFLENTRGWWMGSGGSVRARATK
jgi:hypothetical protein